MFTFLTILSISFSLIMLNIIFTHLVSTVIYSDAPLAWQLEFQDPAAALAEGIINLHDDIMFLLCFIIGLVFTLLTYIFYFFQDPRYTGPQAPEVGGDYVRRSYNYVKLSAHHLLEFVWTIIPSGILISLILPSFSLIYSLDDLFDAEITVKITGHQWFWSYEFGDLVEEDSSCVAFDSYMVSEAELEVGDLRLLEVDNQVVFPVQTHIRLLITSADVLHSWAVPSLGVKMDACPGRLNQVALYITRPGTFYGQCSEICGINHAFMPICVVAV